MKKIISILMVVVMLAACMGTTAFAAEAGDTVTVSFTTSGNPGFMSYGMFIQYDSNVLTLNSVEKGPLSSSGLLFGYNPENNKVAFSHISNVTGDGVLFTATFTVKEDAVPGTYPVTVELDDVADANYEPVALVVNGEDVVVEAPETSQPESSEPETSQPESSEPETSQPESSEPETSQPESSKPESSKPESSKPESSKPESSKPESSKPETSKPESSKPETSKPETSTPETSKPESSKPETSKPETSTPETSKPESSEKGDESELDDVPKTGDYTVVVAAALILITAAAALLIKRVFAK